MHKAALAVESGGLINEYVCIVRPTAWDHNNILVPGYSGRRSIEWCAHKMLAGVSVVQLQQLVHTCSQ